MASGKRISLKQQRFFFNLLNSCRYKVLSIAIVYVVIEQSNLIFRRFCLTHLIHIRLPDILIEMIQKHQKGNCILFVALMLTMQVDRFNED